MHKIRKIFLWLSYFFWSKIFFIKSVGFNQSSDSNRPVSSNQLTAIGSLFYRYLVCCKGDKNVVIDFIVQRVSHTNTITYLILNYKYAFNIFFNDISYVIQFFIFTLFLAVLYFSFHNLISILFFYFICCNLYLLIIKVFWGKCKMKQVLKSNTLMKL